jgi:hypothetical protein
VWRYRPIPSISNRSNSKDSADAEAEIVCDDRAVRYRSFSRTHVALYPDWKSRSNTLRRRFALLDQPRRFNRRHLDEVRGRGFGLSAENERGISFARNQACQRLQVHICLRDDRVSNVAGISSPRRRSAPPGSHRRRLTRALQRQQAGVQPSTRQNDPGNKER